MRHRYIEVLTPLLFCAGLAQAQSRPNDLAPILDRPLETPDVVTYQLRQYLYQRLPKLPAASSAEQWRSESERLRKHLLDDVVFHGWPREWVDAPPKFEDLGVIETGQGYRMRKLRFEIVPGFQSTAILYEPEHLSGKAPAVLNLNGHEYELGKAAEYKQKRCINQALHGMLALNLEWLSCGELNFPENRHQFGGHVDLAGANVAGLFYLAMRRGLDYLDGHPNVDRSRLAVTGLSGGGWQTIVLSALDPRVYISIPVAGYSALLSKLEHSDDRGDNEQVPADFLNGVDYPHLTAMRAPRPTLLIHNAEDDCCFRAPLVKPYTYDQVKPFFGLFGKEDVFAWHENTDPSTHNYQLDNRLQAYRFLSQYFGLPPIEQEIPVDGEVRTPGELAVGLPKDNLTILGLARKFAAGIHRDPAPPNPDARSRWMATAGNRLKALVRYQPAAVEHAWALANTKNRGVETLSWQFLFDNQLSATAVWVHSIAAGIGGRPGPPVTIVLHDDGKKAAASLISDRVNRGEQAVALDLVFHGDAAPAAREMESYPLMISTMGQRALGIEAAQLIAVARWMRERSAGAKIRLESTGKRNQVAALIAAALEPDLFSELSIHDGMRSLQYLLDAPVRFQDAPDLFCLDLYKEFDLDTLALLAGNTRVTQSYLAEPKPR
ncbi:MAG: alpha/beta hydrolase family protein [Bryobacteraceae bacterium]